MPRVKDEFAKAEKIANVTLGKRIRNVRCLAGRSMEDVSSKMGITYQQFQKYEVGENGLSHFRLLQISKILDVDYASLAQAKEGDDIPISPVSQVILNHMARYNKLNYEQKLVINKVINEFLKVVG